jgi:hypothetical protein
VAGTLLALVQAAAVGGIDAAWGRWVWADALIRTAFFALLWAGLVWWLRRRATRPGVRAADLAVRNGQLPPEPHRGELRTGLLHVKRELVVGRAWVVGVFATIGATLGLMTALVGLGGVGWVATSACATVAAVYWALVDLRLRRVDRLLGELDARRLE